MAANNKLITSYFRLNNVKQFIESIDEPANTIYYVFGGKPNQYSAGDNNIDAPAKTVESLRTKVYDEMVFAKEISRSDVSVMANRYDWTSGTVYSMYDDQDNDLEEKQYFVVSQEGDTFYIFKCLFNNNGQPSTSQPLYSATSADDPYYETADGYVWKYLYKLDRTTYNKFSTLLYVPVIPDANVSSNAVPGSIDVIKVESGGKLYNNYLSGSFVAADIKYGGIPLKIRITATNASSTTDFYNGCILKITSGVGVGQYRKILSSVIENGIKFIYIDSPFTIDPTASEYEIFPEVKIYGDGRQIINATARALINTNASNSIYRVDIIDKGKGYFLASANAYAEAVVRTSNTLNDAVLRPILPPKGGHGYDVESELFSSHLGISVKFSNNENQTISTDNDFRTIGILKDPKFNNVKLNYTGKKGTGFIDTEQIFQIDLKRLGGSVQVSSTSKNIIGLGTLTALTINDAGNTTLSNSDIIVISNVAVNAISNLTTNSAGYIESIQLVSAGFGFADAVSPLIKITNATSGNIRYVNTRIIENTTATANGLSYSNSDYIVITSPSATINAKASIVTNSSGGIASLILTDRGKGFNVNEITVIDIAANGRGYDSTANNQLAFSGGGGSGATAYFTNNATGNIVSIILTDPGSNYTSVPSVSFPEQTPTVAASLSVILKSGGISFSVSNSVGGYARGAKISNAGVTSNGTIGLYANNDYIVFPSSFEAGGNAVANVITFADGTLSSINVNSGGNYGFTFDSNVEIIPYAANSTNGRIRYFNGNVVSTITIANASPSYKVSGINITAAGSGYNSTKVLRVDINKGGIGYNSTANNILVFSGGSGSGANATFVNNSLGSIISITMIANGTAYTSAPTVTPTAAAGGIGANLVAVLANSISFTSTTGGYGAVAYFANNGSGAVTSIAIANGGFNYTSAPTATISDPAGVNVVLQAQINGGASIYNSTDVLYVTNGAINAIATVTANATSYLTNLDVTNSGRGFTPATAFAYIVDSTGSNTRYFNGSVIKNIVVVNGGFIGLCSNSDVLTISGGTINATANITTNTVGGLTAVNLSKSGLGFGNHSTLTYKITNTTGGMIRYLNDYVVNSVSIADGGTKFNNTDYIVVSCPGGINAYANIETSTAGVIASIEFKNRGKGIRPSYVSTININNGGTGYSNADIIEFCGGGGTGANALLLTNSSGGIVQAYIVDGGINYNCAPSINIANSIGGTANGTSANLTATITKPSAIRIYNANNEPSIGDFADISITVSLSANVTPNLIYAATLGNTVSVANIVPAAYIEPNLSESANLYFTSILAPNVSINLTGQTTSFSSSLGAGDYIYLQTNDDQSQILQVNSVTNSSHLVVTSFPSFNSSAVAMSSANVKAKGYVLDQAAGYIKVTNVTGLYTQSNVIYGLTSETSATISGISFNGVSKTGTTVNQLFYYSIVGKTGEFEEDEVVYVSAFGNNPNATARYHSGNDSAIYVTSPTGIFYPTNTVIGNSSGATATLLSGSTYKYEGDFVRGSGDIIYIENIEPISRSNSQSETIKLILEF